MLIIPFSDLLVKFVNILYELQIIGGSLFVISSLQITTSLTSLMLFFNMLDLYMYDRNVLKSLLSFHRVGFVYFKAILCAYKFVVLISWELFLLLHDVFFFSFFY